MTEIGPIFALTIARVSSSITYGSVAGAQAFQLAKTVSGDSNTRSCCNLHNINSHGTGSS
jgi:hypothetical protein